MKLKQASTFLFAQRQTLLYVSSIAAVLVSTISIASVCAAPAVTPAGSGEAWSIKQEGETGGSHKTLITKTGVSSENLKAGIVIAAKAPNWDVFVFNRKSKSYCVIPLAKFQGEMSSKLFAADRAELKAAKWRLDGPTRNLGHELLRYKMILSPPNPKEKRYRTPFIVKATYWTFKNIEAPQQCQELLAKIYQLPTQVKGIPFRLFITDTNKGWFENLNTVSAERVDGAVVSVDVPKGYVQKKTQEEVMVDPVSQGVFDSFSKWVEPTLDKKK